MNHRKIHINTNKIGYLTVPGEYNGAIILYLLYKKQYKRTHCNRKVNIRTIFVLSSSHRSHQRVYLLLPVLVHSSLEDHLHGGPWGADEI